MGLATPNGGDALVAAMRRAGTDVAFGVVSVHNLPLVDAIARHLRWVPTRTEAAAVNAADGWARSTGRVGVAVTSTGTGAGNACGALIEALSAGSSVLHVTGQVPTDELGRGRGHIHDFPGQIDLLAAVSRHAATVGRGWAGDGTPGGAPAGGRTPPKDETPVAELLDEAFRRAATAPRGPVSVEWPVDLQYARTDPGPTDPGLTDPGVGADAGPVDPDRVGWFPGLAAPAGPGPDPAAVAAAARLLASARRPLIWAGGGARRAGAALADLLAVLPAGVLTSVSGRGTLPEDDPRVVGAFAATPACEPLLDRADLLLAVGTHFRSNETRDLTLPLPARQIQVDVDPAALGRAYPCAVGIVGEAGATLRALATALAETPHAVEPGWADEVARARAAVRRAVAEAAGPQAALCASLADLLPRDAVICRDVTIPTSTWGNRLLPVHDWRSNLHAAGGGIGQGLATGLGAAVARPEVPTVVLAGDGGLAVDLGELATLAQERPRLVLVVFDDGGYGVLRNTQDAFVGRRAGVDLATPDLVAVARACGLRAERVGTAADFRRVVAAALAERAPAVVVVDVEALGPMPQPFTPPVKVG
ncbi:MAG TPA: thiamine pyrophosphate-binding protein [Acidimicrobiales bacterium]